MKRKGLRPLPAILLTLLLARPAPAQQPPSPLELSTAGQPAAVVGRVSPASVSGEDTLIDLAYREGVGYLNLVAANPGIDPWLPRQGQTILLPTSTILPERLQPGVTINLAEMRLFYSWSYGGRTWVQFYPIGIGREGLASPEGDFFVVVKKENPIWRVPSRIRKEDPTLPEFVHPGPDNPLGNRWLGLSGGDYGIHGTNKPFGVGRRISSGCIRMYPQDVERLFNRIALDTPVRILYQPLKVGVRGPYVYLQAHEDFDGRVPEPLAYVRKALTGVTLDAPLDAELIRRIVEQHTGLPQVIGRRTLPTLAHSTTDNTGAR